MNWFTWCESNQPILKQIDSERIHAGYENIQPDIEFRIINKVMIFHVRLDNLWCTAIKHKLNNKINDPGKNLNVLPMAVFVATDSTDE